MYSTFLQIYRQSTSHFQTFFKAADDHPAFAICTIQRDVFDLRVVAQYIGQKDKEKGASKNDALDAQS